MPSEEKPYRVYRGGRAKGKVPTPKPERGGARKRVADVRVRVDVLLAEVPRLLELLADEERR